MKRILIIEDELEMLRNLTTILRLEKFRPLSAENGRVGVDLAKKEKPDLILCDVMMPGLDGYGVIAALRADAETVTIPFIFLTAKAEKLDIRAGMNLGADDYLTKPVAKAELLAAIHSRLERAVQQAGPEFTPDFRSAVPLKEVLGLKEGGQLFEAVPRRPYSVVLCDEMEKAHPEEGKIADSLGQEIDFRNGIIMHS
jgi:DNA-binding response OmpR family regulator